MTHWPTSDGDRDNLFDSGVARNPDGVRRGTIPLRPSSRPWPMALGGALLLSFAMAGACGSEKTAGEAAEDCEPGASQACDCDPEHSGTQRCRADGLGFLSCDCSGDAEEPGAGGAGGAGGATEAAGAGECVEEGETCERSGDCCSYPNGVCVDSGDVALCAATCEENAACDSGCCAVLDDYTGACAEAEVCGGEEACREDGASCDESGDCCGFEADAPSTYCLDLGREGPGLCSPRCDDDGDCESGCCLPLENGDSACFPADDCG